MLEHGLDFFHSVESIILTVSIILFFSILAGKAGYRFGIPVLLLFLGVGMLFGTDGLGIEFNSHETVQFIGMFSLSIILFSGGMDTRINEIRPILAEGTVLATLGVLLTTAITGGFIYLLFSLIPDFETLSFTEALLLAAVMSSTDSASVFSILRSKNVFLKERLRPTLEMESGSNDPMAYMLTILLISYVTAHGEAVWYDAAISFVIQMVLGAAGGYLIGVLAVKIINRINIGNDSLYPILLMTIVYCRPYVRKPQAYPPQKHIHFLRRFYMALPDYNIPYAGTAREPSRTAARCRGRIVGRSIPDAYSTPFKRLYLPCPVQEFLDKGKDLHIVGRAEGCSPHYLRHLSHDRGA